MIYMISQFIWLPQNVFFFFIFFFYCKLTKLNQCSIYFRKKIIIFFFEIIFKKFKVIFDGININRCTLYAYLHTRLKISTS